MAGRWRSRQGSPSLVFTGSPLARTGICSGGGTRQGGHCCYTDTKWPVQGSSYCEERRALWLEHGEPARHLVVGVDEEPRTQGFPAQRTTAWGGVR